MTDEAHAEEASKELNVVIEETPTEAPVEEAPAVEETPVAEDTEMADQLAAMQQRLDEQAALYDDLKSQTTMPEIKSVQDMVQHDPVVPVEEAVNFGDIYSDPEGFQKNLVDYMAEREAKVAEQAVERVLGSDRLQALEMSHWNNEHDRSVDKAKASFGDRFEYSQEIVAFQQKLPGLSVQDAHRLRDYDKLLAEVQNKKEANAERASTQSASEAAPTRLVQNKADGRVEVKLSPLEKAAADKYFGGDYQKYARGKLRQQSGGVME